MTRFSATLQPEFAPAVVAEARGYCIAGVETLIASNDPAILDQVEASYAAFRLAEQPAVPLIKLSVCAEADASYSLHTAEAVTTGLPNQHTALIALFQQLVRQLLHAWYRRGLYAIHAGAVVQQDRALIIAGRSGQGKTTLTLGLVRQGWQLLSDEFALLERRSGYLQPYPRSLHLRRPTLGLIPELAFVSTTPPAQLGGGLEWAVSLSDLAHAWPGVAAAPARPAAVLLLDGTPDPARPPLISPLPAAQTALELLKGTWAAAIDFEASLATLGEMLTGVACASLRVGALDRTAAAVTEWMEAQRG